jgi:hypothetical protein
MIFKLKADLYLYIKNLKLVFKTKFLVQNYLLYLCLRVVNSERLFCSQKPLLMLVLKLFRLQTLFIIIVFQ